MKLKPLFDRVIVQEEKEETTSSGIFIGKSNNNNVLIGKVLYVGQGNENQDGKFSKMFVNVGDRIIFNKFTAADATISGKQVLILRQTDILAIIE